MKSDLVRAATPDDAPAIARVHVDTWRATYSALIPQAVLDGLSVERREAFWRSIAEAPGEHRLLVAEASGRVVGFASTGPARDDDLPLVRARSWRSTSSQRRGEKATARGSFAGQ